MALVMRHLPQLLPKEQTAAQIHFQILAFKVAVVAVAQRLLQAHSIPKQVRMAAPELPTQYLVRLSLILAAAAVAAVAAAAVVIRAAQQVPAALAVIVHLRELAAAAHLPKLR
jgi:hypothetical protein